MADLKISCPKCSGHIAFSVEMAGREVACPHCGNTLALPKAKSNLALILIVVVVTLLIVGLGTVAILQRVKSSPPKTVKSPQLSAFEALKNKAASGDADAMVQLGVLYMTGDKVPTNKVEGMAWITKAANSGQAQAMTLLAEYLLQDAERAFYTTHTAPADPATGLPLTTMTVNDVPKECLNWFRRAAELGQTNAMWQLACNLNLPAPPADEGELDPINGQPPATIRYYNSATRELMERPTQESVRWLKQLVELGDTKAMVDLGVLYVQPFNEASVVEAGLKLFEKSGDSGNALAYWTLGRVYEIGVCVSKDPFRAIDWYKKGAEKNDVLAEYTLATTYNENPTVKDPQLAFQWFSKLADTYQALRASRSFTNNISGRLIMDSMIAVACAYEKGRGTIKNIAAAIMWYQWAAAEDNAEAQFHLGVIYDLGQDVVADKKEAVKWYLRAANKTGLQALQVGVAESQRNLGYLYKVGDGVPKDAREAFNWFLKSAGNKNAAALYEVAVAYSSGTGVLQDKTQAFTFFQLAANGGNTDAQLELGLLYFDLIRGPANTPENRIAAYTWLNLVAAQGNESAVTLRNAVARKMSAPELADAQQKSKGVADRTSLFINPVPVLGPTAFESSDDDRISIIAPPIFEVLNISAKATEKNDVWWRYSYQLKVRNNGSTPQSARFTIQFIDSQGYQIDSATTTTALSPGQMETLIGDKLVSVPGAARVVNVKAVWKQ